MFNGFHHPTGFNCLYTNADSLVNKIAELRLIVKNSKPKIIAVTETKPKNNRFPIQPVELKIPGFDMFHTPLDSQEGRGCILYVDQEFQAVDTVLETNCQDQVWCTIRLNNGDEFLVGSVYRSPTNSREKNSQLNNLLREASNRKNSHLLIMGDFNFPQIGKHGPL